MKKALTVLAGVALIASVAMADVESANIVGYSTATVNPGFWLVGLNFQTMNSSNQIPISGIIPVDELYADPGGDPDISDQIHVFDGAGYTVYVYGNFGELGDPQWYDFGGPSSVTFPRGTGFWYKRAAASPATNLTVMGQAPNDASFAHDNLPVGFFVMSPAYPNETSIGDLGINAYADPGGDPDVSDQILVFDGAGYTVYVYGNFGELGDPQWYDFGGPTSYALPVGRAAWYKRAVGSGGPASWTENKPY